MSPVPILVALLIAAAAASGWFVRGWREDSLRLDAEVSARKHALRQAENHAVSQAAIDAGRRRTAKEIDDVAKTPGGSGLCFDAGQLRILSDAIKAPRATVPGAGGADGRNGDGGAAVGHGSDLRLPGLRGSVREAERAVTP